MAGSGDRRRALAESQRRQTLSWPTAGCGSPRHSVSAAWTERPPSCRSRARASCRDRRRRASADRRHQFEWRQAGVEFGEPAVSPRPSDTRDSGLPANKVVGLNCGSMVSGRPRPGATSSDSPGSGAAVGQERQAQPSRPTSDAVLALPGGPCEGAPRGGGGAMCVPVRQARWPGRQVGQLAGRPHRRMRHVNTRLQGQTRQAVRLWVVMSGRPAPTQHQSTRPCPCSLTPALRSTTTRCARPLC
jgi:hypothetical protein